MVEVILPASIGTWFQGTAQDGSMLLAIPVALVAGLVSFFSPCVVPLLPGYLSYVTGLSGADIAAHGSTGVRGRMVTGTLLFIAGFSFVFITVGLAVGRLGYLFLDHQRGITQVLGVFTIVVGLVFAGAIPWLQRDVRFHRVPAVGLVAAPFLGGLFGLGWTPCIGPTLSVVYSLAFNQGDSQRATVLVVAYCLGLGIPFLIAAVAFRRMMGAVSWVRRHQQWVQRLGGAMLVVVGLLLLTGAWDYLITWTQTQVVGFGRTPV